MPYALLKEPDSKGCILYYSTYSNFGKGKIMGKENRPVFARGWGKGLIAKASMGIWGEG